MEFTRAMTYSIVSLLILCVCTVASAQHILYFKNQRHSIVKIIFPGNDIYQTQAIYGEYISAVGTCRNGMYIPEKLNGFANHGAITFAVNFPGCYGVATWFGHLLSNHHMSILFAGIYGVPNSDTNAFNATVLGHDNFLPINKKEYDRLAKILQQHHKFN